LPAACHAVRSATALRTATVTEFTLIVVTVVLLVVHSAANLRRTITLKRGRRNWHDL